MSPQALQSLYTCDTSQLLVTCESFPQGKKQHSETRGGSVLFVLQGPCSSLKCSACIFFPSIFY